MATDSSVARLAIPDGDSAELVAALATGFVPGHAVRVINRVPPGPLAERRITVDQTNVSVVVGERLVVKWMRPGADPRAAELLAHLSAVGFTAMPRAYAAVYSIPFAPTGEVDAHYPDVLVPDAPVPDVLVPDVLVALVTEFLPEAVDGWDWCVEDLLAGRTEFAPALGTLAADLHNALATPSHVFPVTVMTTPAPPATTALATLAAASPTLPSAPSSPSSPTLPSAPSSPSAAADWLLGHRSALATALAPLSELAGQPVAMIRPHGDLHVGQILRWRSGYAVIDFDGNPAVAATVWEPAARDVAQLRTSVLHAAQIAIRRAPGRADELLALGQRCADDLLTAYRAGLATPELFDERLLRPFEVEQECRELVYAARFLPRWRYAPMGVLRSWFGP